MADAKLLVFSGPSGTGKGTILNKLIAKGNYSFSVSMTTRLPRPGEVDGREYYFVSKDVFKKTIAEGGLLEYVDKFENFYGTPKAPILEMLAKGQNIILDIEMQGALNVKKAYPEAVLVFVLPPSLAILRERLLGRGTETPEQVAVRTADIKKELAFIKDYDYYIVNENLDDAVSCVEDIVSGQGETHRVSDPEFIIKKYMEE